MRFWPFRKKVVVEKGSSAVGSGQGRVVHSFLSPAEVRQLSGIPPESIPGWFEGEDESVDSFRPNPVFIEYLHEVIRSAGPEDPGLQRAAAEQGAGWVYIIDLRTPDGPQGSVPPEDIIGAFEVRSGRIVAESYQIFPAHRIFTSNGFVVLPAFLMRAFVAGLSKRKPEPAD
jgi:hypothetical protein